MDYKDIIAKIESERNPSPDSIHKKTVSSRSFNPSPKLFVIVFVVAVIIISIISASLVIKNKNKPTDENTSDISLPLTEETEVPSVRTSILLGLTEEHNTNLKFLAIMYLDNTSDIVSINTIPVLYYSTATGLDGTFKSTYENGGITDLTRAVSETYGIKPAHYIITNEVGLSDVFSYAGNVDITTEEDISYSFNGINMIFEKGTHSMNGDMLLKYFCYLVDEGKESSEELRNLFSEVFSLLFDGEDRTFSVTMTKLINDFQTDISAYDISTFSNTADSMIQADAFTNLTLKEINKND